MAPNDCWFHFCEHLFAIGAVDGDFHFPYFENCGNK